MSAALDRADGLERRRCTGDIAVRVFAWAVAAAAFASILYFVAWNANPVLRSDDWYFLDAFLRKAIDGSLRFADFFVKRQGADHAQPLVKLVMWFEWRFLGLDVAFESVVGVFAAAACALVLRRFAMASQGDDGRNARRHLAWAAACALLFSLNASGVWTWPLVAIGYLALVPGLLFVWALWHALATRRLAPVAIATLALGIVADDGAIIVVAAALAAAVFALARDPALRRQAGWKPCVVAVAACLVAARIGYAFAPVVGGPPGEPFGTYLDRLFAAAAGGGWANWIATPLAVSVAYAKPFAWIPDGTWTVIAWTIAALLVLAHVAFWWRAWRGRWNLTTFAAVCLMLLVYAWIAGILVYRVSIFGNAYLAQPRYVQLYAFNLIALLLMWAGPAAPRVSLRTRVVAIAGAAGCALLIAVQVPYTISAWYLRPYLLDSYQQLALQIEQLAKDPAADVRCAPILPICAESPAARARLLDLLRRHRLNVFSPEVLARHPYLARIPGTAGAKASVVAAARAARPVPFCAPVEPGSPGAPSIGIDTGAPAWTTATAAYLAFRSTAQGHSQVEVPVYAVAGMGATITADGHTVALPTGLSKGMTVRLPLSPDAAGDVHIVTIAVQHLRPPTGQDQRSLGVAVGSIRVCGATGAAGG